MYRLTEVYWNDKGDDKSSVLEVSDCDKEFAVSVTICCSSRTNMRSAKITYFNAAMINNFRLGQLRLPFAF